MKASLQPPQKHQHLTPQGRSTPRRSQKSLQKNRKRRQKSTAKKRRRKNPQRKLLQKSTVRKNIRNTPIINSFSSEWEWGWKTPLLLFPSPSFSEDLSHLPTPLVRFLSTPLSDFPLENAERYLLDRLEHLKTSRIGIRFERIQEALFQTHPDTESVRAGLQIPGITEIDLLHKLRTLPGTTLHWEIAVKFYLAVDSAGSDDPDRWIGPSQKDALGVKMRAVRDRQLAVLKDPKIAASIGIPEGETILALPKIHGVLFTPWSLASSLTPSSLRPPGVTPNGQRGLWFSETDSAPFLKFIRAEHPEARLYILNDRKEWIRSHIRSEWIHPSLGFLEVPESETSLKKYFNFRPKTQLSSTSPEKEPFQGVLLSSGKEIRFFCVPDSWKNTAEGALESLKAKSRIRV